MLAHWPLLSSRSKGSCLPDRPVDASHTRTMMLPRLAAAHPVAPPLPPPPPSYRLDGAVHALLGDAGLCGGLHGHLGGNLLGEGSLYRGEVGGEGGRERGCAGDASATARLVLSCRHAAGIELHWRGMACREIGEGAAGNTRTDRARPRTQTNRMERLMVACASVLGRSQGVGCRGAGGWRPGLSVESSAEVCNDVLLAVQCYMCLRARSWRVSWDDTKICRRFLGRVLDATAGQGGHLATHIQRAS